ncbi:hypothetical protein ACFVT9_38435 [Kitasatospora cineracea]
MIAQSEYGYNSTFSTEKLISTQVPSMLSGGGGKPTSSKTWVAA